MHSKLEGTSVVPMYMGVNSGAWRVVTSSDFGVGVMGSPWNFIVSYYSV